MSGPDPYKILQVDPEADPDVIQAAYRRLAQKHHPDRLSREGRSDPQAESRMAAINGAWAILRDPARRAALDRERALAAREPAPAATPRRRSSPLADRWRPDRAGPSVPPSRAQHEWQREAPSDAAGAAPGGDPGPAVAHAGAPPGRPSGSVLTFGRYAGWSLGEIARADPGYLEWLDRMPIGRPYRDEVDGLLRRLGRRSASVEGSERRGLFRRG